MALILVYARMYIPGIYDILQGNILFMGRYSQNDADTVYYQPYVITGRKRYFSSCMVQ